MDTPTNPSNEQPQEEERTFSFTVQRSHFYAGAVLLAFLLGLTFGYLLWGRETGAPTAQNNPAQGSGDAQPATRRFSFDVPAGAMRQGPENAPITMIEFSDFECPYCKRFSLETYPLLMKEYGNQIHYIYIDFPLTSIHPNAFPAAEAALCAGEQDAFWEFRGLLFEGTQGFGEKAYLTYAEELGLDLDTFAECIDEERYSALVQENYDRARALGVSSTPTFLINGIPVVGAQPYANFADVIDAELAGGY